MGPARPTDPCPHANARPFRKHPLLRQCKFLRLCSNFPTRPQGAGREDVSLSHFLPALTFASPSKSTPSPSHPLTWGHSTIATFILADFDTFSKKDHHFLIRPSSHNLAAARAILQDKTPRRAPTIYLTSNFGGLVSASVARKWLWLTSSRPTPSGLAGKVEHCRRNLHCRRSAGARKEPFRRFRLEHGKSEPRLLTELLGPCRRCCACLPG